MEYTFENPPAGEFTYDEFYKMVEYWRNRFCANSLSISPSMDHLRFFGDKKVIYLEKTVRLEGLVFDVPNDSHQ